MSVSRVQHSDPTNTLWNDNHSNLSPYITTVSLTIFLMWYKISLWLIYFITRSSYLLIPSTNFCPASPTTCLLSVSSLSLLCFASLVFYIHIIEILWHWSSSDLFHSASHSLGSSMLSQMALFHSFFYGWVISSVCVCVYLFHSPIDGYSDCFHTLTTVNNAAMKVQFSSVVQSYPTVCNPMDCSMPGFSVHHQLQELTQTHVHRVINAIQPSHPLSSSSPPAFNLSQHQGLFQWVSSSHQVA